jgi:Fe-S-cluster containining protein
MSHTPERLGELYLYAKAEEAAGVELSEYWRDVITIAEMVIRLDEEPDEMIDYTCRRLDRSTGLCTIYERRPKMCREFPYERACGHCGFRAPQPEPALVQIETKATA